MKSHKVELAVENPKHCRTLQDPAIEGVSHIEALLSFKEINKLKKGNANIRPPEERKKPFRAMLETVEFSPQMFHIKNRGITYVCSDANYNDKTGKLEITIPDIKELQANGEVPRFGIMDGGHTYAVIQQTIASEKDYQSVKWVMPHARVHFVVLPQEMVEPVVEALNTSLQVQQYSLDEYQNKFELLKEGLSKGGFDLNLVAFRENESEKEWHVIEIIQRMACFLKERWATTQPAGMYKSKGKALKLFTNQDTRKEFIPLFPVITDILTLPEYIQHQFSRGDIVPLKSLAKLKCTKPLKKPFTRPGTEYTTDHKMDMAALLPMAAAFRALLFMNPDKEYEWRLDYKQVFAKCAERLYDHLNDRISGVALSNMLSSDIEYWAGCYNIVQDAKEEILHRSEKKGFVVKKKDYFQEKETNKALEESQIEYENEEGKEVNVSGEEKE